jgi:hypothetical protein
VRNLGQLATRPIVGFVHRGVELDIETFDRAAHTRDTRADDDDIAMFLDANHIGAHRDPQIQTSREGTRR